MKWWRYIFDERLPKGCRLFQACFSCPAYCYGKKLQEKEILGLTEKEIKEIKDNNMKSETINLLYKIQDQCKAIRKDIDGYMHGDIPHEDKTYLRKVYDAVCKVMDLL